MWGLTFDSSSYRQQSPGIKTVAKDVQMIEQQTRSHIQDWWMADVEKYNNLRCQKV